MASPNSTPVVRNERNLRKQQVKQKLMELLSKFKYRELISETIASQFELEPAEIKHKLNGCKLPNNKDSVTELLIHRSKEFSCDELEEIFYLLMLYRTAFSSKQKTWTPVNLLEPAEDLECSADLRAIRVKILQAFRIKGRNAVVKVISHEEMIWVMIVEKKLIRRKGVKLLPPVFICYEVGTPFIFVASKIPSTIMECILRAMQYKSHKLQQLDGKDVKSLLNLLKYKALHSGETRLVPYQPAEAEIGRRNIDFSKRKARASYANRLFQAHAGISLQTFSVTADAQWQDSNFVPELNGGPFVTSLQLVSKNLIEMIKYIVANEMVATPLPEYMQKVLDSGKNKIVMRVPKKRNREDLSV